MYWIQEDNLSDGFIQATKKRVHLFLLKEKNIFVFEHTETE